MNADDHELIERIRKLNKTLSMFVFALQEGLRIPVDGQLDIAILLDALAETVRARAAEHVAQPNSSANQGTSAQIRRLKPGHHEPGPAPQGIHPELLG